MDELKMDVRAIEKLIYQQSGLLGVSGISSDMRVLLESKEARAKEAIDLYVYRIGRELGSLASALGGLDALVFTAGIGENSAELRARICADAAWLGLELDPEANRGNGQRISRAGSRVSALVVPTNEELMIARHTRAVLTARARRGRPDAQDSPGNQHGSRNSPPHPAGPQGPGRRRRQRLVDRVRLRAGVP